MEAQAREARDAALEEAAAEAREVAAQGEAARLSMHTEPMRFAWSRWRDAGLDAAERIAALKSTPAEAPHAPPAEYATEDNSLLPKRRR